MTNVHLCSVHELTEGPCQSQLQQLSSKLPTNLSYVDCRLPKLLMIFCLRLDSIGEWLR